MSYTCLLMVLCECACANLISKANFNLINRTNLFICLHVMFQISFQHSKGQKSYRQLLGVRSELLLIIFPYVRLFVTAVTFVYFLLVVYVVFCFAYFWFYFQSKVQRKR